MKCELAAALLHRPTTLFLDEPTIGLDVAMQVAIRDFVRSYNQRHEATVLLTSHYMDDVVALCPRIIVIDQRQADPRRRPARAVKTMDPDKRVSFTLAARRSTDDELAQARHACSRATASGSRCASPSASCPASSATCSARCKVADLAIEDPPLEDILREMFGKAREPTRRVSIVVAHAARAADAAARRRRRDRRVSRRVPRLDPDDDAAADHARRCGRSSRDERHVPRLHARRRSSRTTSRR